MAIRRITLSVPEATARRIKKAAGREPVSAWVTERIEEYLNTEELERQWRAFYEEVAPGPEDVRAAEAMLRRMTKARRHRAA